MNNIVVFRGRSIWPWQTVFAYRNLHAACWSLRAVDGPDKGRVIAHADSITLTRCKFVVNEKGRQRVLREQRKNVHAGVVGQIAPVGPVALDTWVRYDPFQAGAFIADGIAPVDSAVHVYLGVDGRVRAAGCQRTSV